MIFPPSSYPNDPKGHAENQAGHAFVGSVLAALVGFLPPEWAWAACGFAYWLVWERIIQRGRLHRDSFEDAVFVASGAALWCTDWPEATGVLAATLALLGVGVWRRS